LLINFLDLE